MKILFTICGRAGSKGFKNKNLKEMNGVPLVFYTLAVIKLYKERHPTDQIYVALNTDSPILKELTEKQSQIEVFFVSRKDELAGDVAPKVSVIQDTFASFSQFDPEVVIDLDITAPYRSVNDIENVIRVYQEGDYDLVFSVVISRRSPYFNMVEKKEDGYFRKICQSQFTARQQAPETFELNASIYAYNPLFLKASIEKTILDYKCGVSIMEDYLVLDIDSEEDFDMMQYLHSYYCSHESGLKQVYDAAREMTEKR